MVVIKSSVSMSEKRWDNETSKGYSTPGYKLNTVFTSPHLKQPRHQPHDFPDATSYRLAPFLSQPSLPNIAHQNFNINIESPTSRRPTTISQKTSTIPQKCPRKFQTSRTYVYLRQGADALVQWLAEKDLSWYFEQFIEICRRKDASCTFYHMWNIVRKWISTIAYYGGWESRTKNGRIKGQKLMEKQLPG